MSRTLRALDGAHSPTRKGDEPRAHLLFWLCDSGLGARKPAKPYCTVSLAPSFRGFSPVCTSAMGVSPNYQTKATKYTIIPAINEINSVILTKNFAGTSLLLHIYCISSEASIPTIQDRINTIIPDLFVAYAIAKEHNAITTTEVIILFFWFFTFFSGILIKEQTCTVQQQLDYEPRRACH